MPRIFCFIGTCALALAVCAPGRAQDSSTPASPSLGDIARQAQKDKAGKPTAKVITNDDVSSDSGNISSPLGTGTSRGAYTASYGNAGDSHSSEAGLAKLQAALDHLSSLDRAGLAAEVLQGNQVNFQGRPQWEAKMFTAKQTFVSQLRGLIQQAVQIEVSAQALKGVQDSNDPRVKALNARLQQLMAATIQDSAAFQAVAEEGKDLAAQAAH
jgi:hypothetical protein